MSAVVITQARVLLDDGTVAATVDLVPIGGGIQVKTVDGSPVEHVHERRDAYHVRLVSPDRSVPDTLREAATYDEAVLLGQQYAVKLAAHAGQVAALAADLAV